MKEANIVPSIIEQLSLKFKKKNIDEININMFDAFWLLHGKFDQLPKKDIDFQPIISKALNYYEPQFRKQVNNFILVAFDDLYDNVEKFTKEQTIYYGDAPIINLLNIAVLSIIRWKERYNKFTKNYASFFDNCDTAWSQNKLSNKNKQSFKPSNYPKIKKFLENKRGLDAAYEQYELYPLLKQEKNLLTREFDKIKKLLFQIFESPSTEFKNAKNFLSSHMPNTEGLLISFEYALGTSINYELLSIYLFISQDKKPKWTGILSKKQEEFICCLYKLLISKYGELKKLFTIHSKPSTKEIEKEFLHYRLSYSPPITFFQIHKIIVLYRALFPSSVLKINHKREEHNYPQKVHVVLRYYDDIFNYTSIPYQCFDFFLSTPPFKILDQFGLDRTHLASILGITNSALSKQISKGTFADKHKWFFLALSGCTYEFLEGLTSIPLYGSDPKSSSDNLYTLDPLVTLGIAENMAKNINSLSSYKENLGTDKGSAKLYLFSSKHQEKITALILEMADLLHTKRQLIEAETDLNRQNELRDFQEIGPNGATPQKLTHITDDNISSTSDHFSELKSILDTTIDALKKATKANTK